MLWYDVDVKIGIQFYPSTPSILLLCITSIYATVEIQRKMHKTIISIACNGIVES